MEQSKAFNSGDWLDLIAIDGEVIALAARYLSMTSWYGHEEDLNKIAEQMQIGGDQQGSSTLCHETQALEFDLSYFSAAVRGGIARSWLAYFPEEQGQLH